MLVGYPNYYIKTDSFIRSYRSYLLIFIYSDKSPLLKFEITNI